MTEKLPIKAERVLIATVGRTPEPVEISLLEHEPDGLLLLASQDSLGVAAAIRSSYPQLESRVQLIEDPENLIEAFRAARKAYKTAKEWGARVILADITGGTKPMTSGLTLALSGLGVTFVYVGGEQRDPDTGRVVSGAERVRALADPTERYHEAEWRAFKGAWNAWRMASAAVVMENLLRSPALGPAERRFYEHLRQVALGLDAWDRFHHEEALRLLNENLAVALGIAEAWNHGAKVRVLKALEGRKGFLGALVQNRGKPTPELLADLLANADRRASAGRYDDALARLYRALELAVESDLYQRTGILLRQPSTWPAELRRKEPHLEQEAGELLGIKRVLDLAFNLDLSLNNKGTVAQRLSGMYRELKPMLAKRHQSILAHGTKPVAHEDYREFREVFEKFGLVPAAPWPSW